MKSPLPASACRHCGCYSPEGRRGGYCQQLSVSVQGGWAACPFAVAAFDAPPPMLEPWSATVLEWSRPLPVEAPAPKPVPVGVPALAASASRSYSSNDVA